MRQLGHDGWVRNTLRFNKSFRTCQFRVEMYEHQMLILLSGKEYFNTKLLYTLFFSDLNLSIKTNSFILRLTFWQCFVLQLSDKLLSNIILLWGEGVSHLSKLHLTIYEWLFHCFEFFLLVRFGLWMFGQLPVSRHAAKDRQISRVTLYNSLLD